MLLGLFVCFVTCFVSYGLLGTCLFVVCGFFVVCWFWAIINFIFVVLDMFWICGIMLLVCL